MPTGLKRYQQAQSLHFITFRCYHRHPLLGAPAAKEPVEVVLEQTRARHQARIYAYVLMPEHVHLLINEPPQILLAQFLDHQADRFAQAARTAREVLAGTLLRDNLQRTEGPLRKSSAIFHRNPVQRGLVENPEDWPRSESP